MNPQIISSFDGGRNNHDLKLTNERLSRQSAYKDQSVIVIIPALQSVPTKAVASWLNLYYPPNQKVVKLFALGMEVGAAYSDTISMIVDHPELSKFKYILTLEADNVPPPDGIVRLLNRMEEFPDLAAIGGLYFTKGEGGQPQIWGNPRDMPLNFRPQPPVPGQVVECCGTGMGFTAFRISMFQDKRLRRPWFKTTASREEGMFTQDLWFWSDARKHGYRCAIDCTISVGHYDINTDITW
jgi:hypothetical protein